MDEKKKRLMETINRNFERGGELLVVIFEMPPEEGERYCVIADGKRIERLRSFEVSVSNAPRLYASERPFYKIEQYADFKKDQFLQELVYKRHPAEEEERH